uniref:Uncharacterized protein n=1 Tax=Meleagris gallopavo TaxID=9103 RepID=A0A803YG41_MELGA
MMNAGKTGILKYNSQVSLKILPGGADCFIQWLKERIIPFECGKCRQVFCTRQLTSSHKCVSALELRIKMSDKSDLKAELERKKQRLAQIREEKKRKEEERKKKEADLQQKKEPAQEDSDLDRKRRETEALLQSIGISPEPPLVPTPMSPSSKSVSTPSDAGSQDSGDLGPIGSTTWLFVIAFSPRMTLCFGSVPTSGT